MATIKSYSDLQQSRKLAEILPLESADMFWMKDLKDFYEVVAIPYSESGADKDDGLPCWSLAALLSIIPTTIGSVFEKDALRLRIDKSETDFNIWYDNLDTHMVEEGFDIIKTNPIDACVAMIEKLNELKIL